MTICPHRRDERFSHLPSSIETAAKNGGLYSEFLRPVFKAHGSTIMRQEASAAPIPSLLFVRCPSHVARFVVAIVVDSLKRVLTAWARPHVGVKVCKRLSPAVAYHYATTAVIFICLACGYVAPCLHGQPDIMLASSAAAMRLPGSAVNIAHCASTAFAVSPAQVAGVHGTLSSACAATQPHDLSISLAVVRDDRVQTERLTCQVFETRAGWKYNLLSHDVTLLERVAEWLEPADVCASVRLASFYQG